MAQDFTLPKYRDLLEALRGAGYRILPVRQFLAEGVPSSPWVVLRHDVDRREERTTAMARLERGAGIHSTYYFRVGWGLAKEKVVREVQELGHEVGYHYEVLSKSQGEPEKACRLFGRELARLREMAEVRTASMHGRPFSRWNNLDFWETHRLEEFGLVGEAYLSFRVFPGAIYFTDTGRCWNSGNNLRDRFSPDGPKMPGPLPTTDDLIRILGDRKYPQVYLLVHPNRWTSAPGVSWLLQRGEDALANWLKRRVRRIAKKGRKTNEGPAR